MKKRDIVFASMALFFLVFFIIWSVLVSRHTLDGFDMAVVNGVVAIRGEKGGPMYWFCRIFTELGFVYVIVGIIIIFLITCKADLKSIFLGLGVGVTYLANMVVKLIIERPRPPLEFRWMTESSMSYPSSHTMCTTFFYGFIIYIILTSKLHKKLKMALASLAIIVIPLVAMTRVFLSVHYFSDVIGGFSFGLVLLFGAIILYEMLKKRDFNGFKNMIERRKGE